MTKVLLLLALFVPSMFAFHYDDIKKDIHKSDELILLKSLDIDPNFVYEEKYNQLKDKIDQLDIHLFVKTIQSDPAIFHTLKDMIQKSNVPDTFLYMAMIESKFLLSAKSNKKAAGLWQLMPSTAKLLKLKNNSYIDERLDPIKSTKAALDYLLYLHKRFKKWYLAALAYNCGETRLSKAIRESGSDDLFTLIDGNKTYIPKETKNYIRRLLIASLISHSKPITSELSKHKKDINLLKNIDVKKRTKLIDIATKNHIHYSTIKKYNAHILRGIVPDNYSVYLPLKNIKQKKSIKKFTYTVKKDDTLLSISKRFKTPMKTIRKLNKNITILIEKGQKIILPLGKNKPPIKKAKNKLKKTNIKEHNTTTYVTQTGDTIFIISQKFNNKVSTIKELNQDLEDKPEIGTKIIIKR